MSSHERALKDDANNVTYQRCHFAYEYVLDTIVGKKLLDVGCGLAYGTSIMATKALEATGLDYDLPTIERNKVTYAEQKNLRFIQGSVPPLPFPEAEFDVITAFQFIEHIEKREAFIRDAIRVLRPGGQLIISTPNSKMSLARNPFHVHEYTFDEMKQTLQKIDGINAQLKGLDANDKVKKYYAENGRFVRAILRWDVLGLHKRLPAAWLSAPYNLITSFMRGKLQEKVSDTAQISTADFSLSDTNLETLYDIYAFIEKQ